jgi:hypothetical protein
MTTRHRFPFVLAIAAAALAAAPPAACAALADAPALDRVVAVEAADSPLGRYRIVFSVTAPLPAPRGGAGGPMLTLGAQPARLPGDPRDRTLLFAYVDELPAGRTALRLASPWPGARDAAGPSEIAFDARSLLERSRPVAGAPEPAHVRRSVGEGVVDVWSASAEADVVLVGRFERGAAAAGALGTWSIGFAAGQVIRAPAGLVLPERLTFALATPPHLYELGARYLLFARQGPDGGLDAGHLVAVRLWWPGDDFVLDFVLKRGAIGDLGAAGPAERADARKLLIDALGSPAAEVRLAAAADLRRHAGADMALTADEADRLREIAAAEPVDAVRAAMESLMGRR